MAKKKKKISEAKKRPKPKKKVKKISKKIVKAKVKPKPKKKMKVIAPKSKKVIKKAPKIETMQLPDEEIAFRLARLYFREVARTGFKKSLELDAIINAYLYALARVKRMDYEIKEIKEAAKRAK